MPRTPLQFQQIKDERKLSILENSLVLFAIHGQKEISVDLISSKAKCSHGLVYHYFKNTDEIFFEIVNSPYYLDLSKKLIHFELNDLAYPQITNIVESLLAIANDTKISIALATLIISDLSKKSFNSNLIKLIAKGQKEGDVTGGDPEDISTCLILLIKGIYLPILNQKHPVIKVPSIDNVMEIFRKRKL